MLIEFAVANFRSIRDEQRLSLVAGSGPELGDTNTLTPDVAPGTKPLRLLRSAAIYGPNAAGKSNLLKAMETMRRIVLTSHQELDALPVVPFRFDNASQSSPTLFEVVILIGGVRYQYGFRATADRVHDEWLFAFPKGRAQRWFERDVSDKTGEHEFGFGEKLTGDKEVWRRATRPNSLFLSAAVNLNSEQLQPIYQWFRLGTETFGVKELTSSKSVARCSSQAGSDTLLTFLQAADLGIAGIHIEGYKDEDRTEATRSFLAQFLQGLSSFKKVYLVHRSDDGQLVELDLNDESDGTRKMFAFAAPWLEALETGQTLAVDELHDNLHPLLVRYLIELFHSPKTNPKGAQLIFTTHETSILSQEIFRRDQIWFCERDEQQATRLFPLTDFSPRMGRENLERAYLSGRYGALPYLRSLSEAFRD
jgi:uncharacterized protein